MKLIPFTGRDGRMTFVDPARVVIVTEERGEPLTVSFGEKWTAIYLATNHKILVDTPIGEVAAAINEARP